MPCLEISMPETSIETKEKLAKSLTDTFGDASGYPSEIFGIHFNEYKQGYAASGGKICDPEVERPYIHFLLYIPRINRDQKKKLVAGFSKAFTATLGKPGWIPVVHISEHPYENVGVEGDLLADKFEELGKKEYYYSLN